MSARTKARKRALDILFEADQRGANVSQVLEERVTLSGRETALPEYAAQIVAGVVAHWTEIQEILQEASTEWTIDRMPAVDRALLRIATWEILFNNEVTVAVAIDEAVGLARDLSTDDSPRFINGVLGTVARDAPALPSDTAAGADTGTTPTDGQPPEGT
ncbi:transcription antitermination factor NusB [Demequina sp.]|uniref:transcription antitermination factor NusB n=1 Tax=Demequina sp. TaxID=2050685 RepID=UPI0025BAB18A|nr:transcription antitermination factor NusB [Demequina sp.]